MTTLRQRRKPIVPVGIVRELDAFVKVENDFKQPTTTGGTSINILYFFKNLLSSSSFDYYNNCCNLPKYYPYRYISK